MAGRLREFASFSTQRDELRLFMLTVINSFEPIDLRD